MKSLKKVLSITLCVMLLISTLTFSASAALTYTEYTWQEPVGVSTLNGKSYVGDDYKFGAPGSSFNTASTISGGNIKLTQSSASTPMCAYFKWDISEYTIDEIVSVRFICITQDNNLNLYSMPEASWSEATAPLLSSGSSIARVVSEDEVPESYFDGYGSSWTRRYYDITSAVVAAKNNNQSSFVLGVESNNLYNTYLGGLNGAKPAIQFKTAEEKVVEATSKSTVQEKWESTVKIKTKNGSANSGDNYIIGVPGETISSTSAISGGYVKLNTSNAIYMRVDISKYSVDDILAARFMFWSSNNTVSIYSIPDTLWNTETAPLLTSGTQLFNAAKPGNGSTENIPSEYVFEHSDWKFRNADITVALKTAIEAKQQYFVLAMQGAQTVYIRGMNNTEYGPGIQIKTSSLVDTAATFTGTLAAGNDLTLTYAIDNGWDTDLSVDCIIAVYDSNKALKYVDIETITVSSLDTVGDTFVYTIPADAGDLTGCTAKAMIWNSDFTPLVTVIPLVAVN